MMQSGFIIRIFVARPGDVTAERDRASEVIAEWNGANSFDRQAVIEPVKIETHARSEMGDHPQEIINKHLLDRCDYLVAIFWSKLGTPTNKKKSGTIHEIEEFAQRKGADRVMLFFSDQPVPKSQLNINDLKALDTYKRQLQKESFYVSFKNTDDFAVKFRNQLDMRINRQLDSFPVVDARMRQALIDILHLTPVYGQMVEERTGKPVPKPPE
jgi:hypothetical protein